MLRTHFALPRVSDAQRRPGAAQLRPAASRARRSELVDARASCRNGTRCDTRPSSVRLGRELPLAAAPQPAVGGLGEVVAGSTVVDGITGIRQSSSEAMIRLAQQVLGRGLGIKGSHPVPSHCWPPVRRPEAWRPRGVALHPSGSMPGSPAPRRSQSLNAQDCISPSRATYAAVMHRPPSCTAVALEKCTGRVHGLSRVAGIPRHALDTSQSVSERPGNSLGTCRAAALLLGLG